MSVLNEIMAISDCPLEEQQAFLREYEEQCPYDSMLPLAKAIVAFFASDFETAEEEVKKAIVQMPSRYMNHVYYAMIAFARKKYKEAAQECLIATNFATQFNVPENWQQTSEQLQEILTECMNNLPELEQRKMKTLSRILKTPGSFFPLLRSADMEGWTLFANAFLYSDSASPYNHFVGITGTAYYDNVTATFAQTLFNANQYNLYANFPTESWYAKSTAAETFQGEECIVPVAAVKAGQEIQFISEKAQQKQLMACPGLFHYYRVNQPVTIKSDIPYVMGKPVPLKHDPKRKRLVLMIFHDALSQQDLTATDFANMPNTKKFFDKGTIFKKCYSTAEWTHPSFASLFTGLYTTKHQIIYRSSAYRFPAHVKTLGEMFRDAGYFTANISSSVGVSPYLGGMRGFDRVINKSCMGFSDAELIDDTIDHIEAFADTDQFVMLSLFEQHHHSEDTTTASISHNIAQQTAVNYENSLQKIDSTQKSVRKQYHGPSVERYRVGQRQADRRLKQLYDYISDNYKEDEYLVCLVSDHGVSFLEDRKQLLKDSVTNSVLMMRGADVPVGISEEYINHIDLFSSLEKFAGLTPDTAEHDCSLPKTFGGNGRPYAYSESVYNGQTYKAVIRDGEYDYFFETNAVTKEDGAIDLSEGYSMEIYKAGTREEVEDSVLYECLETMVYDHIKQYILY